MKTLLPGLFFLLASTSASAQVTYTTNPTPQGIANLLQGSDITISNVTIKCDTNAIGLLYGNNIGLIPDTSLALSSGYVWALAKPNTSNSESYITIGTGDPDFTVLGETTTLTSV